MRNIAKTLAAAALLGATLLPTPAPAAEVDPFYQQLLEEGVRAHQRGDYLRAREELRIAAFGLLESPAKLARALVHLSLVQSATGNLEGFAHSYARLTELETRFRAFSAADLSDELRTALDQAARSHLGTALVRDLMAAAAVAPDEQTIAKPETRLCISWSGDGECPQAAPADDPPPVPVAAPQEPAKKPNDRRYVQRAGNQESAG